MAPRTHGPFSAGEQGARTGHGEMAPEVRRQHILKCFELSNARAILARVIEFALGEARGAHPAREGGNPLVGAW